MLRQRQREEEEQRRAHEAARLRRAKAQAEAEKRQRAHKYYEEDSDDEEVPEFNIVRGRDGRLYRVRNPHYQPAVKSPRRRPVAHQTEPKIVRGPDGNLYRVDPSESRAPMDTSSSEDKENVSSSPRDSFAKRSNTMDMDDDFVEKKVEAPTKHKKKKRSKNGKKKKKKITVIVEDASDSEYDDEFNSPWRNRRPSPGQWMEPVEVENFQ